MCLAYIEEMMLQWSLYIYHVSISTCLLRTQFDGNFSMSCAWILYVHAFGSPLGHPKAICHTHFCGLFNLQDFFLLSQNNKNIGN